MHTNRNAVRRSVTLPAQLAKRVQSLARSKHASLNRVLVDLVESGLDARESEKQRFLELAERLSQSQDAGEQKRLKEELARMTFGD